MNEWRVIFATVVIFGTGVVTGGLLVSHVDQSHFHGGAAHKAANPNNAAAGPNLDTNGAGPIFRVSEILNKPSFLNNLDTRLTKEKQALSLEQRKSIEAAIAEGQKEMRQLVQTVNQSVRQELTPEQRKKYDELL